MRPLTEDQLSMLLSEVEVWGPATAEDLDLTMEQGEMIRFKKVPARADALLDHLHTVGLVPCGFCFGTGYWRGYAWSTPRGFHRRFSCTYCNGTGRAT
jgi:hypothetical protein